MTCSFLAWLLILLTSVLPCHQDQAMLNRVNPFSAISAGSMLASSGTVVFSNSNGVSFGLSGNTVTASVSSGAPSLTFSAGTLSETLGSLVFSNSGGVSFGLSGSTLTATVATNYQSQGAYLTTADLSQNSSKYAGTNGAITGGSMTVNTSGVSVALPAYLTTAMQSNAVTLSNINVSAGTTSNNLSALTFSNSNGLAFGLSGSTITGSYTVPNVPAQTNQSAIQALGVSNTGNTAGNTGVSTGINFAIAGTNNITASQSTTAGGPNTIWVSGPTLTQYLTTAALSQNSSLYAGVNGAITGGSITVNTSGVSVNLPAYLTTADLSQNSSNYMSAWSLAGAHTAGTTTSAQGVELYLSGGNNITLSGSSNTIIISGPNVGGAQTGISGVADGAHTQTVGTISFANSNGVTFGISTGANTGTITASVAAQTNQAGSVYASSNTFGTSSGTYDARTLSIAGSGAVSVAASNSGWVISAPVQSNQTVSFAATSNTAGNTSGMSVDARSVTLAGYGAASVGYSTSAGGSTVIVSVPNVVAQTVQTQNCIDATLAGNSTSAGAGYVLMSSGTITWAGGNNVTLSQNGNAVTISAFNQSVQTQNCVDVTLAGNSTSAGAGYALVSSGTLVLAGGNNVTLSQNGQSVTISAFNQTNQSAIKGLGASNTGNTAGNTGISSGIDWILAGTNNVTVSESTSAGGPNTLWISGPTAAVQSNQTLSFAATSNTAGNTSGMTVDARSITLAGYGAASVGYSTSAGGSTVLVSVPVQSAQTQSNIQAIYDGANSISTGTIRFTNANGVSFSVNGQTLSASVAAQTAQTLSAIVSSNTVGNTSGMTFDARSVSFQGYGAVSVGLSTTNTGSSILFSAPTQTVQTQNCVDLSYGSAAGGTTTGTMALISSGTALIYAGNNLNLSQNNQSMTLSVPNMVMAAGVSNIGNTAGNTQTNTGTIVFSGGANITLSQSTNASGATIGITGGAGAGNVNFSAGTTSSGLGSVVFSNSNGVSFGLNGSTITASVAAQSNQTLSAIVSSNTVGNTSGMTFDARSVSFQGYGAVSVGLSTTNTGSSILFSAPVQSNQTLGLYALGNTTQNSSTTLDARTVSFNAIGAASWGYSNGSVQVSVPATSSLIGYNQITVTTTGSTISVGNIPLSAWEPFPILTGTAYSSHAPASWWFNRVVFPDVLAISNINVVKSLSVAVPTDTLASSGKNAISYSHGITVFSRQDYGAHSSNLTTVTTASLGITGSISYTSVSMSVAYSWVTDTTGGTTSFSTTSGAANWSNYFSGPFVFGVPCVTTLQAGEYFFAHQHSTTTGTTGNSNFTFLSFSNLHVVPQVAGPLQLPGQSITQASLNPWGMGGGIASAITTNNSMPGSVISGQTQNNWYAALSNV